MKYNTGTSWLNIAFNNIIHTEKIYIFFIKKKEHKYLQLLHASVISSQNN